MHLQCQGITLLYFLLHLLLCHVPKFFLYGLIPFLLWLHVKKILTSRLYFCSIFIFSYHGIVARPIRNWNFPLLHFLVWLNQQIYWHPHCRKLVICYIALSTFEVNCSSSSICWVKKVFFHLAVLIITSYMLLISIIIFWNHFMVKKFFIIGPIITKGTKASFSTLSHSPHHLHKKVTYVLNMFFALGFNTSTIPTELPSALPTKILMTPQLTNLLWSILLWKCIFLQIFATKTRHLSSQKKNVEKGMDPWNLLLNCFPVMWQY